MCVLDLLSVEVCVPGLLPHVIVVGSSNNVLEYPVLGGRGLVAVLPVDWFRLVNQLGLHISCPIQISIAFRDSYGLGAV